MRTLSRVTFGLLSGILMLLAMALVGYGVAELVSAVRSSWHDADDALLTAIGYVVIAMAVFDVAKFFVEEEVLFRHEAPSVAGARRTLARFISTIAIAVFIEGLVIVFQVSKQDVTAMLYPTALLVTAVLIVLGLGAYQYLSLHNERPTAGKDDAN